MYINKILTRLKMLIQRELVEQLQASLFVILEHQVSSKVDLVVCILHHSKERKQYCFFL